MTAEGLMALDDNQCVWRFGNTRLVGDVVFGSFASEAWVVTKMPSGTGPVRGPAPRSPFARRTDFSHPRD